VWQGSIDSKAWEHIEKKWCEFNIEPRHLKLGLATIGVNPYSHFSSKYSMWPICFVNYILATKPFHQKNIYHVQLYCPQQRASEEYGCILETIV
jgi:hypothetical protein